MSSGGGTGPLCARSGRELFYVVPPGRLMTVSIQPGPAFAAGNPRLVFEGPYTNTAFGRSYDVSVDGRRFLMMKEAVSTDAATPPPQIVVVQNWLEELKRLVPAN